jgi:signal peptidase I
MTASEDEREHFRREPDTDWIEIPRMDEESESRSDGREGDAPEPDEDAHLTRRQRRAKERVTPGAKPVKKGSFWKELPILVVIALVLTFLIQTFVARVYVIPSGSMEQTLNGCTGCTGDRILVDKLTLDFTDPKPGEVIVFKGPPGWDQSEFNVDESSNVVVRWLRQFGSSIGIGTPPEYDLVKRIIAVGGQTVRCCDAQNRVVVDGKPLNEPYVYLEPGTESIAYHPFGPVTIPQGDLWVMGDNRGNSDDSRFQNHGGINGVVPVSDVIGVARTIIWPPSRWRGIGETNPQAVQGVGLGAPAWQEGLPAGIGFAAAFPALWLGKKTRRGLRSLRRERR